MRKNLKRFILVVRDEMWSLKEARKKSCTIVMVISMIFMEFTSFFGLKLLFRN